MWTFIYVHKKRSACPISITIRCEELDVHYQMLEAKLEQAKELGFDLPSIDNYELAHQIHD